MITGFYIYFRPLKPGAKKTAFGSVAKGGALSFVAKLDKATKFAETEMADKVLKQYAEDIKKAGYFASVVEERLAKNIKI